MTEDRFLTAQEAAAELGISLGSLYAYASRGMLRSEPVPGDPRARRYPREDVLRLKDRKELRKDPEKAVPKTLSWGTTALLESAITLIQDGRIYYRGRDAVELARTWSVEQVAALLWTGNPGDAERLFQEEPPALPAWAAALFAEDLSPIERCQAALPLAGAADLAAYDLRPAAVPATAARILRFLAGVAAGGRPAASSIAGTLQEGWAPGRPEVAGPIGTALILAADHELNVSAFTARCVASANATPYDVVAAGLAALKGIRHGGETARMEILFREAEMLGPRRALADRLRSGGKVPGFGQPLYPEGDPRGRALLELAAGLAPRSPAVHLAQALADAGRELLREHPTIDFGLVALGRALELPDKTPLAMFALGRTLGWIGHAIEEYGLDRLIRPRAAYVGEMPGG